MEVDSQTLRHVWWKGAISGALKGIPQGLMLGAIGFGVLAAGIYLFGATALVGSFGSFLFGDAAAAAAAITAGNVGAFIGTLSPVTFIALNTVLTSVGNFLTGGTMACNAYKQDVEHRMNETRIDQLEARGMAHMPSFVPSRTVKTIISQGTRQQQSFASAEQARAENSTTPALH